MSDFKNEVSSFIDNLNLNKEISLNDIPKLDLYMDQIITLFDNNLKDTKRKDKDKLLTKTMINNYTKDKILPPGENKKYSRNHIIMMIIIYNLKQSLTITDIKTLLNPMVENLKSTDKNLNLENLYEIFLDLKNLDNKNFKIEVSKKLDTILNKISDLDKDTTYFKTLLTVLILINKSNMYKRLAENIIDNSL